MKNLIGATCGAWMVLRKGDPIQRKGNKYGNKYRYTYVCKSTCCGREATKPYDSLIKLTSTKCIDCQNVGPIVSYYKRVQRDAKIRKFEFSLSVDNFKELITQPCHYCGCKPTLKGINQTLQSMGFHKIASAILHIGKAPVIKLRESSHGTGWYVTTPYSAEATNSWRLIPGRKWASETKENFVPHVSVFELKELLDAHYPGSEIQEG